MRKTLYLLVFLTLFALPTKAQVPVALLPPSHQQFFLPSGAPNAGGCVFFYNSGTSTPAPTYTDVSGVILNSNPVLLDSSGYATIYLANQEYAVAEWTAGGVNCASGTQIWSQSGVSAYQILSGTQTIIFSGVTSFPSGTAGEVIYRTDLGRLCFFYTLWDCIPGLATTDTFTNKTINVDANTLDSTTNTAGLYLRNNGTQYVGSTIQTTDFPTGAVLPSPVISNPVINGTITGSSNVLTCGLACGVTPQYIYQSVAPVTAHAASTAQQTLMRTTIANTPMNTSTATLHLHAEGDVTVNANPTVITWYIEVGAGNWIAFTGTFSKTLISATPWIIDARCTTVTPGAAATVKCYGTAWTAIDATGISSTSISNLAPGLIDTTAPLDFGWGVSFGASSTSNSATQSIGWMEYIQ